eukprot:g7057.t1
MKNIGKNLKTLGKKIRESGAASSRTPNVDRSAPSSVAGDDLDEPPSPTVPREVFADLQNSLRDMASQYEAEKQKGTSREDTLRILQKEVDDKEHALKAKEEGLEQKTKEEEKLRKKHEKHKKEYEAALQQVQALEAKVSELVQQHPCMLFFFISLFSTTFDEVERLQQALREAEERIASADQKLDAAKQKLASADEQTVAAAQKAAAALAAAEERRAATEKAMRQEFELQLKALAVRHEEEKLGNEKLNLEKEKWMLETEKRVAEEREKWASDSGAEKSADREVWERETAEKLKLAKGKLEVELEKKQLADREKWAKDSEEKWEEKLLKVKTALEAEVALARAEGQKLSEAERLQADEKLQAAKADSDAEQQKLRAALAVEFASKLEQEQKQWEQQATDGLAAAEANWKKDNEADLNRQKLVSEKEKARALEQASASAAERSEHERQLFQNLAEEHLAKEKQLWQQQAEETLAREKANWESGVLRPRLEDERATLEQEKAKATAAAVSEAKQVWLSEMSQNNQEKREVLAEELEKVHRETVEKLEAELANAEKKLVVEVDEVKLELQEMYARKIADVEAAHERKLEEVELLHDKELGAARLEGEKMLGRAAEEKFSEVEKVRGQLGQELKELRGQLEAVEREKTDVRENCEKRLEEVRQSRVGSDEKIHATHDEERKRLTLAHETAVRQLEASAEERLQQLRDAKTSEAENLVKAHEQQLEQLKSAHEAELRSVREAHTAELRSVRETELRSRDGMMLKLVREKDEFAEQLVAKQKLQGEEQLQKLAAEKDTYFVQQMQVLREGHANAVQLMQDEHGRELKRKEEQELRLAREKLEGVKKEVLSQCEVEKDAEKAKLESALKVQELELSAAAEKSRLAAEFLERRLTEVERSELELKERESVLLVEKERLECRLENLKTERAGAEALLDAERAKWQLEREENIERGKTEAQEWERIQSEMRERLEEERRKWENDRAEFVAKVAEVEGKWRAAEVQLVERGRMLEKTEGERSAARAEHEERVRGLEEALHARETDAKAEKDRHKEEIEKAQNTHDAAKARLEEERAKALERERAEAKAKAAEINELKEKLQKLQQEVSLEKSSLDAKTAEVLTKNGALEDKLTRFEVDVIKLRGENESLKEEMKSAEKAFSSRLETMQSTHAREKLEAVGEITKLRDTETTRYHEQVLDLRAQIHAAEASNRQLRAELSPLQRGRPPKKTDQEIATSEDQTVDVTSSPTSSKRNAELARELSSRIESQAVSLQQKDSLIAELQTKLQTQTSKANVLETHLTTKQTEFELEKKRSKTSADELERGIGQMREQFSAELREKLASERRHAETLKGTLEEQLQTARDLLEAMVKERDGLKEALMEQGFTSPKKAKSRNPDRKSRSSSPKKLAALGGTVGGGTAMIGGSTRGVANRDAPAGGGVEVDSSRQRQLDAAQDQEHDSDEKRPGDVDVDAHELAKQQAALYTSNLIAEQLSRDGVYKYKSPEVSPRLLFPHNSTFHSKTYSNSTRPRNAQMNPEPHRTKTTTVAGGAAPFSQLLAPVPEQCPGSDEVAAERGPKDVRGSGSPRRSRSRSPDVPSGATPSRAELQQLKSSLEAEKKEATEWRRDREQLVADLQNEALRAQEATLKAENARMTSEESSLRTENADLIACEANLRAENAKLTADLEKTQQEIAEAKQQFQRSAQRAEELDEKPKAASAAAVTTSFSAAVPETAKPPPSSQFPKPRRPGPEPTEPSAAAAVPENTFSADSVEDEYDLDLSRSLSPPQRSGQPQVGPQVDRGMAADTKKALQGSAASKLKTSPRAMEGLVEPIPQGTELENAESSGASLGPKDNENSWRLKEIKLKQDRNEELLVSQAQRGVAAGAGGVVSEPHTPQSAVASEVSTRSQQGSVVLSPPRPQVAARAGRQNTAADEKILQPHHEDTTRTSAVTRVDADVVEPLESNYLLQATSKFGRASRSCSLEEKKRVQFKSPNHLVSYKSPDPPGSGAVTLDGRGGDLLELCLQPPSVGEVLQFSPSTFAGPSPSFEQSLTRGEQGSELGSSQAARSASPRPQSVTA